MAMTRLILKIEEWYDSYIFNIAELKNEIRFKIALHSVPLLRIKITLHIVPLGVMGNSEIS